MSEKNKNSFINKDKNWDHKSSWSQSTKIY